jgi:hypothetical protein
MEVKKKGSLGIQGIGRLVMRDQNLNHVLRFTHHPNHRNLFIHRRRHERKLNTMNENP